MAANEQKPCFFCGLRRKTSKEHALPEWIFELLKTEYPDAKLRSGLGELDFDSPLLLNKVCKVCNEGWMSRLEQAVKPIISRAILGHAPGIQLDRAQQEIVATWVAKTLMVFESIGRPKAYGGVSYFNPKERLAMAANQTPLKNSWVWLAGCDGSKITRFASHRNKSFRLASKPPSFNKGEVYTATLKVGWLIVQLFTLWRRPNEPTGKGNCSVTVYTPKYWQGTSALIWPPEMSDILVDWPPFYGIDQSAFNAFVLRIEEGSPATATRMNKILFEITD